MYKIYDDFIFYYHSLVYRVEMQMHLRYILARILPVAHLNKVNPGRTINVTTSNFIQFLFFLS